MMNPAIVRQDIFHALQEGFPLRGWHLSLHFAEASLKYAYPVHSTEPELDEEGLPKKDQLTVLFSVDAQELVLTADFRLEACKVLGGRPWICPPLAQERQWLRFANTNGSLEVILDANKVPPFQEKLMYPKQADWDSRVEYWAKRFQAAKDASGRCTDLLAKFVLTQLAAMRDSANHMLHQALGKLVHRIEKSVPDYWLLAELAMADLLEDEMGQQALAALKAYTLGQGAFTVKTFQRPVGLPTDKVQ